MKNYNVSQLTLVLASAWLLGVAGCSSPSSTTAEGRDGGFLQVGNGDEPQELDPQVVTGVPEHRICGALFEGLVNLDPETLAPMPGAAASWTVSDDGTLYRFQLRPEGRWSNGDPVTAGDFVYAWQRILSPGLASEYGYMLWCIKNARAYNEGLLTDFSQVGVRALDDLELEVTLEHPTAYFLSMQVHSSWYPVHRATIERIGAMDERGTKWTQPGNHVGNGAFMLKEWYPNKVITVVRNPYYWNAAEVRLPGVSFHPINDLLTEERNFRRGRLHLTENVPVNKIEVYQREHPEQLHIDPYLGTYFYRLNVTRPPFDDVRVRRAFAMALDRETLVNKVVKGGRQAAYHFTPPDTAGYTCAATIPYDVEEARRLLAEAGYPNGESFPQVELLYNTSENHKLIAAAVQQMWKESLNVEVGLLNQDWKVYLASMQNLDYGMARSGWIADVVDPINFLECFTTGNGNNRTGYSSAAYDDLITQAAREADPATRRGLFQQAEALLMADAPLVPIYFYTRVYLMSPKVKGWHSNPLGYIPFKDLYLDGGT